jgi:tetratricopeptide (TPR) repeat protein
VPHMRIGRSLLAIAIWLAAATAARGDDAIRAAGLRHVGRIVQMTAQEVTLVTSVKNETIPVNQIESLDFDGEPTVLKNARNCVADGRYADAQKFLEGVNLDNIDRAELKQEVEFYAALATTRLALSGKLRIVDAGKLMGDFVSKYPQNFHYLEANELLGDLLVANMRYGDARKYYERVGQAPWPDYKMRAAVAIGQVLLAEGKPEEAMKSFEGVLRMKAADGLSQAQHLAATLGKARCLAETKQADEAIKIARDVIAKADAAEDAALLARAYNTLGVALRKAGRTQEALFAFLRVDTLYSSDGDAHAEALYHLVHVWQDLKNVVRMQETRRILEDQYKESRWCKAMEK